MENDIPRDWNPVEVTDKRRFLHVVPKKQLQNGLICSSEEFLKETEKALQKKALELGIVFPSLVFRHIASLLYDSFFGRDMLNPHVLLQRHFPNIDERENPADVSVSLFEEALSLACQKLPDGSYSEALPAAVGDVALLTDGIFLLCGVSSPSQYSGLSTRDDIDGEIGFSKEYSGLSEQPLGKQDFRDREERIFDVVLTRSARLRVIAWKAFTYACDMACSKRQAYLEKLYDSLAKHVPFISSLLQQMAFGMVSPSILENLTASQRSQGGEFGKERTLKRVK